MYVCVFMLNITLSIPAKLLISRTAKKEDVIIKKNDINNNNNKQESCRIAATCLNQR